MDYNVSYRKKDGSIQCIISYKDSDGKWKQRSKQGFKTQKASKPWQDKIIEELENNYELNNKIKDEYKGITLKEFKKIYLDNAKITKSYNTYLTYENGLNKFKSLDDKLLSEIKFIDVKEIILQLIKKGYSTGSLKKFTSVISSLFKVAKEEYEIINNNPLQDKKLIDSEKKDKFKVNALTKKESKDLLDKMYPYKDYVITLIGLHTGFYVKLIKNIYK